MVRPVTDDDVGLRLLYQAIVANENLDDLVDIVAVHGLGAHPDDTWSKKRETEGEQVWVNWLQEPDMLPASVPNTRIMRYGYKSGWFGKDSVEKTARTVAHTLLLALQRERKKFPTRPLIFIGHSFGGLVMMRALCEAFDEKIEWPNMFDSVVGMIFLGTPFRGTDGMSQSQMLQAAAQEYDDEDIEKEPLHILDPGNEILQDLVDRFHKIRARSHQAPIACFFEQQASEVGAVVGRQRRRAFVVNERSGCLDLSQRVKKYPLDKTHFTMNKFANPNEEGFLTLRDVVQKMVQDGLELCKSISTLTRKILAASDKTPIVEGTYSRICKRRVRSFIGRESQLQKIQWYFSEQGAGEPRILILQALGGQGKSQLALEYCRKSKSTYRGVFWVNGFSEKTVMQSFENMAAELGEVSLSVHGDAETKVRFVKGVLEQYGERWLLVFDNYDDPVSFRNVERFFPSKGRGDILLTSRHKGLDRLGTVVEVPPMPTQDGVSLLLQGYSEVKIADHMKVGTKIVSRLGGLALAIDQAAAYIQYKKLPIERLASFLALYEAQSIKILGYTSPHFWKYSTLQIHGKEEQDRAISAFTTWEMSFQQFTYGCPQTTLDAGHFLTLSAFFDPSHIEETIFRYHWEDSATRPTWMRIFAATADMTSEEKSSSSSDAGHVYQGDLEHSTWGGERFWDLIAEAHKLSLLESISSDDGQREANFSLHPLIRDWLQLRENVEERRVYTQESIDFVVSAIRVYNTTSTTYYQKALLAAHADACVLNDRRFSQSKQGLGWDIASCNAALWLGIFYRNLGRYGISETLVRLTKRTRETILGKDHHDTLASMNNLATVLSDQGRYEEAGEIHRQVLGLGETVLGKEHPDTLASMNNLATVLRDQGKYEEAGEIHRQVLGLRETVLGKEHPSTLTSMSNLATVLSGQRKYEEAEEIHRQVLGLGETVLGKEHPVTLVSMSNLVFLLWHQHRLEEAEELEIRILGTRKRVLGLEHPDTLTSMASLAHTWKSQGRDKEAVDQMKQAVRQLEQKLGFDHPNTMEYAKTLDKWLAEVESSEGPPSKRLRRRIAYE